MISNIQNFILFLFLIQLLSCTNTPTLEPEPQEKVTAQEDLPRYFMSTQSRHLRVRQTPDLEGTVLQILQEDVIVEYLHDSTSFTTAINYNQKNYNQNWLKIRTTNKTEGWVYSAFVKFLPDAENQKIVIQRETAELLEASNQKENQITDKQKKELTQPINNSSVQNYKVFLSGLDKSNPNSVKVAIDKFNSNFVDRANARTCDQAYVAFHDFYIRMLEMLSRKNLTAYQHLAPEIQRYKRATMLNDEFTKSLGENGFNFALENSKVVLAEDVDFLYRVFYRECSTPMRAYMNQYQLEEPNFWLDQDLLLISPIQLTRWILAWNYFVATYPDFVWYDNAKKRLEEKLNILLQGTLKQPAFDSNTYTLKDSYFEAYSYIVEKYPESKIGRVFKEYLDVLETNNKKSSSEVTQTQNKIMKTLVL